MPYINEWRIMGHVGRDPFVKKVDGEVSTVIFSVAVQRPSRSDGGDPVTDWVKVFLNGRQAGLNADLEKGELVQVSGRAGCELYTPKDGAEPRASMTMSGFLIQRLSRKGDYAPTQRPRTTSHHAPRAEESQEEVPF